jgi:hypothetical protein
MLFKLEGRRLFVKKNVHPQDDTDSHPLSGQTKSPPLPDWQNPLSGSFWDPDSPD